MSMCKPITSRSRSELTSRVSSVNGRDLKRSCAANPGIGQNCNKQRNNNKKCLMGFKARRWYVWRAWHVGDPISHHAQLKRFFFIEAIFRDHIHSFHFCFRCSWFFRRAFGWARAWQHTLRAAFNLRTMLNRRNGLRFL